VLATGKRADVRQHSHRVPSDDGASLGVARGRGRRRDARHGRYRRARCVHTAKRVADRGAFDTTAFTIAAWVEYTNLSYSGYECPVGKVLDSTNYNS
jgi:hypothetical protein